MPRDQALGFLDGLQAFWKELAAGIGRGRTLVELSDAWLEGAVWEWNGEVTSDRVEGSATEFCQVVTQVRIVADTKLRVTGEVARRWMSIAQCFAGPVSDPPAPGTRFTGR